MISVLTELFSEAAHLVAKHADRSQARKARHWEHVEDALDDLTKLARDHVTAINEVGEPIIERRDLPETLRRFRQLVNNPDLAGAYGMVNGVLKAARESKQFKHETLQQSLTIVLQHVDDFRHAVFMLDLDIGGSWGVADVLDLGEQLRSLLPEDPSVTVDGRVQALQEAFSPPFAKMVEWLRNEYPDASLTEIPLLDSRGAVVDAVRAWFQDWQRYVQKTLYAKRGLNDAVGALKMAY